MICAFPFLGDPGAQSIFQFLRMESEDSRNMCQIWINSLGKRFDVAQCEIDTKTRTVIGYQITLFKNRHSWRLLGSFDQWNPGRRANETLSPRNVGHRETGVLAVRVIAPPVRND